MTPSRHGLTVLALAVVFGTIGVGATDPSSVEDSPPKIAGDEFRIALDWPEGWYARIETSMGRIVARLLPRQAPQSVAHFAALADGRLEWIDPVTGEATKDHYYDGVTVHKAEAGRQFETGDRTGTGSGSPLIYVPEEGFGPVSFKQKGRLGMTRSSGRRISGVQFFVTAAGQPWFDRRYPCFGMVVDGQETVFNISQVKTYSNGRPLEPVVIESVRIFKVGDPDPLPEPVRFIPTPARIELIE